MRKDLMFGITQVDKGAKVTTSVEVLLKLPTSEKLANHMSTAKSGSQFKLNLHDMVDSEFIKKFQTFYWGDVSDTIA